jgi:hypothetical protein
LRSVYDTTLREDVPATFSTSWQAQLGATRKLDALMDGRPFPFDRWPTGTKLLLILSAALPARPALAWAARDSLATPTTQSRSSRRAGPRVARSIESLLRATHSRLSVAANGAFRDQAGAPCVARRSLWALTPASLRASRIRDRQAKCFAPPADFGRGATNMLIGPATSAMGLAGGRASTYGSALRRHGDRDMSRRRAAGAALEVGKDVQRAVISDGASELRFIAPRLRPAARQLRQSRSDAAASLQVRTVDRREPHHDLRPGGDDAAAC